MNIPALFISYHQVTFLNYNEIASSFTVQKGGDQEKDQMGYNENVKRRPGKVIITSILRPHVPGT